MFLSVNSSKGRNILRSSSHGATNREETFTVTIREETDEQIIECVYVGQLNTENQTAEIK